MINTLTWFDCHCHFDFPVFAADRAQHWAWLQSLGLAGLFIPGVERAQGEKLAALCQGQPWFYAQGLHPYFMDRHRIDDLYWLETELARDPNILAVGEIGLDLPQAKQANNLEQQWQFLQAQVELAHSFKKPLVIHVRGLHDELCAYLKQRRFSYRGLVHAFSGSEQQAKNWLDLGFKLGLGGAISHSRAHKLRTSVRNLPVEAWLLETDSPDMKAAFWGDNRYSPAAIPLLAAYLAQLKNQELAVIALHLQQQLSEIWPTMAEVYVG